MTALEILQHISQLAGDGLSIERKHSVNNVIGTGLISGIEVPRLGRRLERTHDDPRGIRTQIKNLTIQEWKL